MVRVASEKLFTRTALRASAHKAILRLRPNWSITDPARCEVWLCQYRDDAFIAGVRLTGPAFRQHHGRVVQRPGALRPTVAAAMVLLAGPPTGALIDPCCGSGTILYEAYIVGWNAIGCDLDPAAVTAARANAPAARVTVGDCRRLDLAPGGAGAWVANVPFGRKFTLPPNAQAWLRSTLSEAARVVRCGGRIVLLSPHLARTAVPPETRTLASHRIRVLGVAATIWVLQSER